MRCLFRRSPVGLPVLARTVFYGNDTEKETLMSVCRKHRYSTRVEALIVLARIQRRDSPSRPKSEKRAYRCHRCRSWHLTSEELRKATGSFAAAS